MKKEKVTLLYPPNVLNNTSRFSLPPLGLLYIASSLKEAGIDVCVIDAQLHQMGMNDIIKKIIEKKPTILGISLTTDVVLIVLEIIKRVKEADSSIKIVLGGAHINSTKDEIFSYTSDVDCLVCGEAEETFVELVKNFGKDIAGVIYPNREFRIRPLKENLDDIPFINFDLIDNFKTYRMYHARNKKVGSLVVTRGCPYSCSFCNVFNSAGRKYRKMSPERIIKEVINLQKNWGIEYICFKDSTFTLDKEWILSLCNKIKKLNIEWRCHTRVDLVDKNLLHTMKKAGCTCISYGFESGSQKILNILKKGTTVEQIKNACKMTHKAGIEIHATFMIGNPQETLEDVNKTIKLAKKIHIDYVMFYCTTAFPNTELYDNAVSNGQLSDAKWYMKRDNKRESKILISTEENSWLKCNFNQKELVMKAYRSFYFRPSFMMKAMVKTIRNPYFIYTIAEAFPQVLRLKRDKEKNRK